MTDDWRTRARPAYVAPLVVGERADGPQFRPGPGWKGIRLDTKAHGRQLAADIERDLAAEREAELELASRRAVTRRKQASKRVSPLKSDLVMIRQQVGITLPLRLGRGLNSHAKTAKVESFKRKAEAEKVWLGMLAARLEVTLTRISPSPKPLDRDNLVASLKATQDQVAAWLRVDDGEQHVRFEHEQERGPWGVRVEVRLVGRAR